MSKVRHLLPVLFLLLLSACITSQKEVSQRQPIELVETIPFEIDHTHHDTIATAKAWLNLIKNAKKSIDICQQYANIVNPSESMQAVIKALEAAAERGVKVRILLGDHLQKRGVQDVIQSVKALRTIKNVEIRETNRWDKLTGIMHAKYMIIDQQHTYIGSANLDWKALDHIAEIGVIIHQPDTASALSKVFNHDWKHFADEKTNQNLPVGLSEKVYWKEKRSFGWYHLAISPKTDGLPEEDWDFYHLIGHINQAKSSVRIAAMGYYTSFYGTREPFHEIEQALIAAAKRGLRVELMLEASKTKDSIIANLLRAGVIVHKVSIPEHSSGPISYARLMHIKLGLFDDEAVWIGTSNLGGGYFYRSRNLSVFIQSIEIARRLEKVFSTYWYAPWTQAAELSDDPKETP